MSQPMLCGFCGSTRTWPEDFPNRGYAQCRSCTELEAAPAADHSWRSVAKIRPWAIAAYSFACMLVGYAVGWWVWGHK